MTDRHDDVEGKSDDIDVLEGERNWASNNVDRYEDVAGKKEVTTLVFWEGERNLAGTNVDRWRRTTKKNDDTGVSGGKKRQ